MSLKQRDVSIMNHQIKRRNPTEPYKRITQPKPRIRGDALNKKAIDYINKNKS